MKALLRIPAVLLLLIQSVPISDASSRTVPRRSLQAFGTGGNLKTAPPTPSPTIDTVGTVAPKDNWTAKNITFVYQLWTTEKLTQRRRRLNFGVGGNLESSTKDEVNPVSVVQKAYRETLREFVLDTDAPVTIQRLESTEQGLCRYMPNTLPFANFTECTDIETIIYILLDEDGFDSRILDDQLRDVPFKFNTDTELNQGAARIVFLDNVQAELLIVLHGVATKMNESETDLFEGVMVATLDGLLMDDYDLTAAKASEQESSSSGNRRERQLDESYNKINVTLSAVCSASDNCTFAVFQQALDDSAPEYGQILLDALLLEAQGNYSYFLDISNVTIATDRNEEEVQKGPVKAASDYTQNDNSSGDGGGGGKKLSIWAILGIVAAVITVVIIPCAYYCLKKQKAMQLKDPEDQFNDRFDGSMGQSAQFGYGYETDEEEDNYNPNLHQLPAHLSPSRREEEYDDQEDDDEDSYEGEFSVQVGDFTVVDGYSVSSDGQPLAREPFEEPKRKKKKKKKKRKKHHKHRHRSDY